VRSFESEPLQVREDYYAQKQQNVNHDHQTTDDSEIEIISKELSTSCSSKLYSSVLLKAATESGSHHATASHTDSDEIEDAEDVLAMEIDNMLKDDQDIAVAAATPTNNIDDDYGIEVVDEGSALDLEKICMSKGKDFPIR